MGGATSPAEPSGWSPDEESSTSSTLTPHLSGHERRVEEVEVAMAASLPAAKVTEVRLGDDSGTRTNKSGDELC